MEYYKVKDIIDRRVDAFTGAVEYLVQWEGYTDADNTWEPRHLVVEYCADAVQRIDQECMEKTDSVLAKWRRSTPLCSSKRAEKKAKRRRGSVDEGASAPDETLTGLLLRDKATHSSVVMLGQVVLTEEASHALSTGRKKQKGASSEVHTLCRPAVQLAKRWKASCTNAVLQDGNGLTATPLKGNFVSKCGGGGAPVEQNSVPATSHIKVLGIAPAHACVSGHAYVRPTTFVPWLGIEATEQLQHASVAKRPWLMQSAQELIAPQCDMVVRFCDSTLSSSISQEERELDILAMPLSVFRDAFPQVLIDYLLDNSMILESGR